MTGTDGKRLSQMPAHLIMCRRNEVVQSTPRKIGGGVALLHITSTSRLVSVLKKDNRAIFAAAAKASEAVGYLKKLVAGEGVRHA